MFSCFLSCLSSCLPFTQSTYGEGREEVCNDEHSLAMAKGRKTKTKVITLANQKDRDNPVNQSKLKVITRSRHKTRKNVHAQATIGFGFTSDWLKKWRENFEPINE